jgi:hypothetical protein
MYTPRLLLSLALLSGLSGLTGLAGLASPAAAAQSAPERALPAGTNVAHVGIYDYATQSLQALPPLIGGADAPVSCWNNVDGNNFYTSLTHSSTQFKEALDWGTYTSCTPLQRVKRFDISYSTNDSATIQLRVRFYTGSLGFGVKGTQIAEYTLTNLPGSVTGNQEVKQVTVDVSSNPFDLPNGAFGTSFQCPAFTAGKGTGPMLVGPPNAAGDVNGFDRYNPDGSYSGTQIYTGGTPFASLYIRIYSDDGFNPCAGGLIKNSSAANLGKLNPAGSTQVGWTTKFYGTHAQPPLKGALATLYLSAAPASLFVPGGEQMVDLTQLVASFPPQRFMQVAGAAEKYSPVFTFTAPPPDPDLSFVEFSYAVPNVPALIGTQYWAQMLYANPLNPGEPLRWTNQVQMTICPL